METEIILLYSIATLVFLLSMFCSLSEASIVALTEYKASVISNNSKNLEKGLSIILKNEPKHLAAIIMLNTIVNIGGSMLVGKLANDIYDNNLYTAFIVSITILMLLFSEIKPKVYAAKNPEIVIKFIYIPIILFTWILTPLVNMVNGLLNNNNSDNEEKMSAEQVNYFLTSAKNTGFLKKDEAVMMKNILELRTQTSEVLLRSNKITMIKVNQKISDNEDFIVNSPHRRIILINENEKPVGLFFKETALEKIIKKEADVSFAEIIQPLPIIDEACPVPVLARKLQKAGSHLAVFVDEKDGKVSGIVSLADIKGLIFS